MLEGVAGILLECPNDIGEIIFGMYIPDFQFRIGTVDGIAYRMNQVRLAQADTAIDEERVIGCLLYTSPSPRD